MFDHTKIELFSNKTNFCRIFIELIIASKLQITGNTIQERFSSAVEGLKIKFAATRIAEKTGYKKTTVSEYLNTKEPSEAFIRTFAKQFELDFEQIWTGKRGEDEKRQKNDGTEETQPLEKLASALADQAAANKIQAIANKENAEAINKLASAIEKMGTNFGTILNTQDAGFGLVAELLSRQVRIDANGNEEKVKRDLDEIAKRIGPGLGSIARKGIGADERM